jgi:hypothetical protein
LANTEVAAPLGKIDSEPIVGLVERLSSGADGIGGIVTDAGGLIQTAVGKAGGFGSRRTNRSGCAVYAAANTAARWMHTVSV